MVNWFAQKRYGCGSGMPVTWQGWVVLIAYMAVVIGGALLVRRSPAAGFSIIVPATILFIVISFRTTQGGWGCRWRNKK